MTIKLAPTGIPFDASAAVVLGIGNGIANFGLPLLPHVHAPLLPNFPLILRMPKARRMLWQCLCQVLRCQLHLTLIHKVEWMFHHVLHVVVVVALHIVRPPLTLSPCLGL